MTPTLLRSYTCKDLAQMAKLSGVPGWHAMRKDQLIRASTSAGRKKSGPPMKLTGNGNVPTSQGRATAMRSKTDPKIQEKISKLQSKLQEIKNLAAASDRGGNDKVVTDRLVLMVRDPYWLHAFWELSRRSIGRAQAALGQNWRTAKPVLRLFKVGSDGVSAEPRDIEIHGGVNNWYIDVQNPPHEFRAEIGYRSGDGRFYSLSRSNTVATPPAGVSEALDENWVDVADNADRIFAMSGGYSPHGTSMELQELLEEHLNRPMGSTMSTRFGAGASAVLDDQENFEFAVDAELVVYGVANKGTPLTLKGEPVKLRPDGSFSVRLNLPNRRQVVPVVASSSDGVEQRTVVLAVERNTKVMEPIIRHPGT